MTRFPLLCSWQGGDLDGDGQGSPNQYSYEALMQLGDTVGAVSRGASEDAIGALPTVTYKMAREQLAANIDTKCSICQEEFEDDDEVRVMPCKHAEHAECLDQWLRVNKCCPICKAEVPAL